MQELIEPSASGAVFDLTGTYRYLLWRRWESSLPRIAFVMLNPSTADAERLDPTIRRCLGFAKAWGFGTMLVVNLYAFRTANPRELARAIDPVGPRNQEFVSLACRAADRIVVAWGNSGTDEIFGPEKASAFCFGLTKRGHPRHPLYLPQNTQLVSMGRATMGPR